MSDEKQTEPETEDDSLTADERAIAAAEKRRTAKRAASTAERNAQHVKDLEALECVEEAEGVTNVKIVDFAFLPGLPTIAVVSTPSGAAMTRWRDTLKKGDKPVDNLAKANEAMAIVTLKYPTREVFELMCAARPAFKATCGDAAVGLAGGRQREEGKG